MSRTRTRHVSILVLVVGVVVTQAVTASASPPGAARADAASRISADELIDLQLIAEQRGISLEQAINDVAWQDDFASMATELEERFPDEFAGAEIGDAAGRVAGIAFEGAVPAVAVSRAADFGLAGCG